MGRFEPVFTVEKEIELKECVLIMEKRLAYQISQRNIILHNFSHNEMAVRDWVAEFIKRNKDIS